MRPILLSAAIAAIVSAAVALAMRLDPSAGEPADVRTAPIPDSAPSRGTPDTFPEPAVRNLRYTDALAEDVWINAAGQPGADRRTLTDAATSMCFITKIELSGIRSPDDQSSCAMQIDAFTGFWELVATVEEGGRSSVRCNARCLVWDEKSSNENE